MEIRYSCFFIGHRDAKASLRPALDAAVEQHITEYGVTDFVVGHYGAFDALAAGAVKAAKKRHPEVTLSEKGTVEAAFPFGHRERTEYGADCTAAGADHPRQEGHGYPAAGEKETPEGCGLLPGIHRQ